MKAETRRVKTVTSITLYPHGGEMLYFDDVYDVECGNVIAYEVSFSHGSARASFVGVPYSLLREIRS